MLCFPEKKDYQIFGKAQSAIDQRRRQYSSLFISLKFSPTFPHTHTHQPPCWQPCSSTLPQLFSASGLQIRPRLSCSSTHARSLALPCSFCHLLFCGKSISLCSLASAPFLLALSLFLSFGHSPIIFGFFSFRLLSYLLLHLTTRSPVLVHFDSRFPLQCVFFFVSIVKYGFDVCDVYCYVRWYLFTAVYVRVDTRELLHQTRVFNIAF